PLAGRGAPLCGKGVVVLVESTQPYESDELGEMPAVAADVCAAHTQDRPQHLIGRAGSTVMCQRRAETLAPEAPYAFIANVRVWGGWVGNHRLYPEAAKSVQRACYMDLRRLCPV